MKSKITEDTMCTEPATSRTQASTVPFSQLAIGSQCLKLIFIILYPSRHSIGLKIASCILLLLGVNVATAYMLSSASL